MGPPVKIFLAVNCACCFHRTLRNPVKNRGITPLEHNTKGIFFGWLGNLRADKCCDFLMIFGRILNIIFVSQLIYMVQMFFVLFKKLMAVQPMLKRSIEWG